MTLHLFCQRSDRGVSFIYSSIEAGGRNGSDKLGERRGNFEGSDEVKEESDATREEGATTKPQSFHYICRGRG